MSADLKSGLDPASFSSVTTANTDLFRYVNGPWIDTYRLPDDRSRYGSFDRLAENAEDQIRDILESDDDVATKSKALYRSFLDEQAVQDAGMEPIRVDLGMIDAAGTKAELTRALGTLSPTGGPDLIDFSIYGDPKDPDINVLHVGQGGLGLPDEAYYRQDHYAPIREAYVAMVAKQLQHAGYADDDESAAAMAQRYLAVETAIAAHHWDNVATRDPQKTNNPMTFDELNAKLSHFDLAAWIDAMQQSYDAAPASQAQPVDVRGAFNRSIVHEPSFIEGLDAYWNDAELDDLKLWARVHVIIGRASMLSSDFDTTNFEFYGKVLSGAKEQRARWKRGVSLVNGICGEDVGQVYVHKHFPESSKAHVTKLVHNLIEAYHVSILNSPWLGDDTKRKALDKLDKFGVRIGYPDQWRDYAALDVHDTQGLVDNMRAAALYEFGFQLAKCGKPVDKNEWLMNPQTVNAYYEPSLNIIVFPAAILQPPFFDPDVEDAANYGGIGCVIGHEIGHGFDDQGSQYDGEGKLNDWWTAEDKARFQELTAALIGQYNEFVPQQLRDKYADDPEHMPHVNGALTIGENIGDLSGVNIALKAYAFALDERDGRPIDGDPRAVEASLDTAPVIDGFTGLQRFFLSYASIWRSKNRDELAEQYLQIDPHSPAEHRVNGIARNVDLFYKAFGVTADDRMWLEPEARVHIW
ncbi:M13 family metallopeptidase [Bifidobacterium gallicum]|uniref:Peptidase M13 n=1 Tax=Bifidobacterium gallicum DSM 20093 = LMG 11596 TaxID=561180 RepID=D1NUV3_9BIFI|nr:M13-type metalloendopeptidase [Bifidobacterium gallicum]EFA22604.1 peptidase family M13 [Bifidobacterium gallicum DSM 20093 = LMG 11596]KFI59582.1 peptidase M13 [Bifidobacterium gallicum DSM 20093 = LMG 11596]